MLLIWERKKKKKNSEINFRESLVQKVSTGETFQNKKISSFRGISRELDFKMLNITKDVDQLKRDLQK